jgi:lipid-A-disaccharide synthase-like uncharacterized protein
LVVQYVRLWIGGWLYGLECGIFGELPSLGAVRNTMLLQEHIDAQAHRQQLYQAQALKYQDGEHSAQQEFDKAVLTLSAALLAFSVGFIKDVVPISQATAMPILFWSWGLFGGAVIMMLASFFASRRAFIERRTQAYDYYVNDNETARDSQGPFELATQYLTYGAGLCFAAALVLTLIFAMVNLQRYTAIGGAKNKGDKTDMTKQDSSKVVMPDFGKGVVPAQLVKIPQQQRVIAPIGPSGSQSQTSAAPKNGGK